MMCLAGSGEVGEMWGVKEGMIIRMMTMIVTTNV